MADRFVVGIDVGGTKIASGLVNIGGEVLARFKTNAHSEKQPEDVIAAVVQAYEELLQKGGVSRGDVVAVGIGFPSPINAKTGVISSCSNLPGWCDTPLRDVLARRIGLPVLLDNDAHLGAVGEHRFGAGRGVRNMCYLCFSTGFGLGIIIDNQLYIGHTGTAGELSHIVIHVDGPLCTCGKKGCLMTYASGIGIARQVKERIAAGEETLLRHMLPVDGRRIGGDLVAQAARQGDRVAEEIIRTAGYYFGVGMSILIQLINPELFVIGGGLTQIGASLMEPVLEGMRANTQQELIDSARIVSAQLGSDVGIVGAAAETFNLLERNQWGRFSLP
jgi:glucokinase